ncbi:MAG: hypothetical protein WAO95_15355 [Burkholderiales bacterium]
MNNEKITVRHTDTGKTMEVVVFSKRAEAIEVVIGEGMHNMKCVLTPTRNGMAYAGSIMGREIVYERSRDKVKADIDLANPNLRKPRAR